MSADGRAIVPNGGGGDAVPQYLRLFDVTARELVAEVALRDGRPQPGNFGVLVVDGRAFVSDPGRGTIETFDLDGLGDRQVLAARHEAPDGMAWTPVRLNVLTRP
jgi:hypothetical protein